MILAYDKWSRVHTTGGSGRVRSAAQFFPRNKAAQAMTTSITRARPIRTPSSAVVLDACKRTVAIASGANMNLLPSWFALHPRPFVQISLFFQRSLNPTLLVTRLNSAALVLFLFSARNRERELQISSFIIHRKWHYCQTFLGFSARYMGDFALFEEQTPGPFGVIGFRCIFYLPCRDACPDEVCLAAARDDARAFERAKFGAKRFHFKTVQLQTSLHFFKEFIVESRAIVLD